MSAITVILLLFGVVAGLRLLADRPGVPLPTLLVLGGLVVAMRDRSEIGDSVMRKLLSEFDHEELLLRRREG